MRYLVVVTSTEEDAAAGGVPLDQTHSSAVAVQLQHRLRHVAPQTALGDLPYSHLRGFYETQGECETRRSQPEHKNVINIFIALQYEAQTAAEQN